MTKRAKKVWFILLGISLFFLVAGIISFFVIKSKLSVDLPDIKNIAENPPVASQIFDRNGDFVESVQLDQYRIALPYASVPERMRLAIVASEDERFYRHKGYDIIAITRALYNNLFGKGTQGGSTITQQLARDLFFQRDKSTDYFERSFTRKIKELLLAVELEKKYTKEEILEYFMNYEYFGPGPPGSRSFGVEAASRNFFGKPVSQISLSEAAIIAGTLDAPSLHSPWMRADLAVERGNFVLDKMLRNKFISKKEYDAALIKSIESPNSTTRTTVKNKDQQGIVFLKPYYEKSQNDAKHYFIDYVKQQVIDLFPEGSMLSEGLKIYTTLDLSLQNTTMNAMTATFAQAESDGYFPKKLFDKFGVQQPQGQIVILQPKSGEVLAMVGGRSFDNAQFNRCTALRQPGSLFKIFDYTAAVDSGVVGTGTMITSDQFSMPDQEKVWQPEEWTGKGSYFGPITVQYALVKSSNICAIKVAQRTGWDRVAYYAEKMGIPRYILPVPSMAIGSLEVAPVEMATAFGVLANAGERVNPISIKKITTKDDKLIYEFTAKRCKVLDSDTTYIMNILFGNVFAGLNGDLGFDAGGKTGTSEDFLSGWFVGYTPDIVICSWVGRDSREVTELNARLWGSAFAAPMVRSLMLMILKQQDSWKGPPYINKTPFSKSAGNVVSFSLCSESGLLATDDCPPNLRVGSTYRRGYGPSQYCQIHRAEFEFVKICLDTGLIANEWCPNTIEKAFLKGTGPQEKCKLHLVPLTLLFEPNDFKLNQPIKITFHIANQKGDVVELYIDSQRVIVLKEAPYEYEWVPEEVGKHHIKAILRKDETLVEPVWERDVEVRKE